MKFIFITLFLVIAVLASSEAVKPVMKYYIFSEDCYNKFLAQDFSDQQCIKFTISKAIGLAIVAGSSILKVPQILKIVSNGSVEGISSLTYYIEVSELIFFIL
jgi:mannose-P-dolichol utilization defect protein 1